MIGAVVGDAACMHLQWIYDQDKIAEIVQAGQDPAFWNENHCPFFTLPTGKLTCFADEAVQSLNAMEANDCVFDENKIIEHFLDYFGAETSPYQMALENRKSKAYPIEGPWIQGTVIKMMDRFRSGINPPGSDNARDHDGLVTALPLIIQQGSNYNPNVLTRAFEIMTQDPFSIEHHKAEAFIIGQFIKNETDPIQASKNKFEGIIDEEIKAVENGKSIGIEAKALVKQFGLGCPMPGSFQSSLVSIIGAQSYADAIRETIRAGGDCGSRANFIGACLGAKYGIQNIPLKWLANVSGIEDLFEKSIKCFWLQ